MIRIGRLPIMRRFTARVAIAGMSLLAAGCTGPKKSSLTLCISKDISDIASKEGVAKIAQQVCGIADPTPKMIEQIQERVAEHFPKLAYEWCSNGSANFGCVESKNPAELVIKLSPFSTSLCEETQHAITLSAEQAKAKLCPPMIIDAGVLEAGPKVVEEKDAEAPAPKEPDAGTKPVPTQQPKTAPTTPGTRTRPVPTTKPTVTKSYSPI